MILVVFPACTELSMLFLFLEPFLHLFNALRVERISEVPGRVRRQTDDCLDVSVSEPLSDRRSFSKNRARWNYDVLQ